ncbi:MAG: TlpA family protein disulfide reductase [Acidobacteriia bacterium]|nr:TlpA family protein disulfide reductase [Terriglobia bacterium]
MSHRNRNRLAWGIALLSVCLVTPGRTPAAVIATNLRKAAPDFTLKDSKGASFRLSKYRGKVVLLNFWATTCGGCKVEIPWFMEFQNRYKRGGLAVIGVSLDEDGWKSVRPYLKEKAMNYRVAVGDDDLASRYGVDALPMTLLIDRDGKIAASYPGMVDKAGCEREIHKLLKP